MPVVLPVWLVAGAGWLAVCLLLMFDMNGKVVPISSQSFPMEQTRRSPDVLHYGRNRSAMQRVVIAWLLGP